MTGSFQQELFTYTWNYRKDDSQPWTLKKDVTNETDKKYTIPAIPYKDPAFRAAVGQYQFVVKLKTGQVLIVQPQSKFGIARKSILSHGMAIISEKLSFEKENITPVILAYLGKGGYVEKADLQNDTCSRVAPIDFGYELPPWYFEDESFFPAIELEKKKNIAIMESIEGSKQKSGVKMEEAYRASKQKIDYINENMGSHMEEKVL